MTAPAFAHGQVKQTLVLVDFPRPDIARILSPNGRAHWRAKYAAVASVDHLVTSIALIQKLQPMQGFITIEPRFIYPVSRKRDDDNLATGVMKVVRDVLVKRGYLLADDMEHLRQLPVVVRVEKGRRALVLEFVETA